MNEKSRPTTQELIDMTYATIGDSPRFLIAIKNVFRKNNYREPEFSHILKNAFTHGGIVREESDLIKALLDIRQIQNSFVNLIRDEKILAINAILDEYPNLPDHTISRLEPLITPQGFASWIEAQRARSRIMMLLRDPKNENDDHADVKTLRWKSMTAFITPENICLLRKSEDDVSELVFIEAIVHERQTYLRLSFNGEYDQRLISLNSWETLSINDFLRMKYASDAIIQKSEWWAKDAYVVTQSDGTKIGYLATHSASTSWKEIKNVRWLTTNPIPWIIQGSAHKTTIIPINS